MKHLFFSCLRSLALAALLLGGMPVFASGGGEGAAAGPAPMQFTVNVGTKMLQVEIVFEFATVEASHLLGAIKPKVQHRIILLLTSEDVPTLQTTKGKLDLQERLVKEMNGLIDETAETGVKEALFTRFIMQ